MGEYLFPVGEGSGSLPVQVYCPEPDCVTVAFDFCVADTDGNKSQIERAVVTIRRGDLGLEHGDE